MNKRGSKFLRALWLLPAALWLIVIFHFSGQSAEESGALSSSIAEKILEPVPELEIGLTTMDLILRKSAHFGIFAVEGFLLCMGLQMLRRERRGNALIASAICAILAVLNELHQLTAIDRACSVGDMALDFCGALSGVILAVMVYCTVRELQRRSILRRKINHF
ncbi:MAG: VanZ family protein [Clostridia bacterium]|nr:VanZ family protein [Clostridia bacterium]